MNKKRARRARRTITSSLQPPTPVLRIGVLGPHECGNEDRALGVSVGAAIASRNAILVCGGLGGMMAAAAEGAQREGGTTIGLLPGTSAADANPFIDIPLPTGLGAFRNMMIVQSCDAVIAIRGGYGTLSEIAFALRLGVPVIGLKTWTLSRDEKADPGIHTASSPEEAVDLAVRLAQQK